MNQIEKFKNVFSSRVPCAKAKTFWKQLHEKIYLCERELNIIHYSLGIRSQLTV